MSATTHPALAILNVRHNGDLKMVGKLFALKQPAADGTTLGFLHCHEANQRHYSTNAPAPLDEAVVHYLDKSGVTQVYCYCRDTKIMRRATVAAIKAAPAILQDGRCRHCLAEPDWDILGGVTERRVGKGARTYHHPQYGIVAATPYLRREVVAEMGVW